MNVFKVATVLAMALFFTACNQEANKGDVVAEEVFEEEEIKREITVEVKEASYDVPSYDPTTIVFYDKIGLGVEDTDNVINQRLGELHIPVHNELRNAGLSTENIKDGKVLNTTILFLANGEKAELDNFYKAVLANVAKEQGWDVSEDGYTLTDKDGNRKMHLKFFETTGSKRMALNFYDPVEEEDME